MARCQACFFQLFVELRRAPTKPFNLGGDKCRNARATMGRSFLIKLVTTGLLVKAAIVFILLSVPASSAQADACDAAMARFNSAAAAVNREVAAKVLKALGHSPDSLQLPAECPKALPVARSLLPAFQRLVVLQQESLNICGSRASMIPAAVPQGFNSKDPDQALLGYQHVIAQCQAAMVGRQKATTPTPAGTSPTVSASSGSCSDVTGLGPPIACPTDSGSTASPGAHSTKSRAQPAQQPQQPDAVVAMDSILKGLMNPPPTVNVSPTVNAPPSQVASAPASPPTPAPTSTSGDDRCIIIGRTHTWGRTLEDNGQWQTNYATVVKPSLRSGCSKDPMISYKEPNGAQQTVAAVPGGYKIQTTGGPPTDIHVLP
jgi:hypothetical protein